MAQSPVKLAKMARTPARDRCRPFLVRAMAEGWSGPRLSKESKVSLGVASAMLREESQKHQEIADKEISGGLNKAVREAGKVRDRQVEQLERMTSLTDKVLEQLEAKAEAGEVSVRDLDTLVRLKEKHWQHTKDLAGLHVAEKIAIGQARGEATGSAIAAGLIDSTAIKIGEDIWMEEEEEKDAVIEIA